MSREVKYQSDNRFETNNLYSNPMHPTSEVSRKGIDAVILDADN